MKKINNFESAKGALDVTLYANRYTDGTFYGRVSRRTVDLENLIADIAHNNAGVSQLMVQHIASLLQTEILRLLGLGFSVNLLELGTLYLATEGSIRGKSAADIPPLSVHFTPSATLKERAAAMKVEHVLLGDGLPVIDRVEDTFRTGDEAKGMISISRVIRIVGSRLRLGADAARNGIFFVPAVEDGTANRDESAWIKADAVIKNKPSALECYVPASLKAGERYYLAVRSDYQGGSVVRKDAVTVFSEAVKAEA